MQAAIALLEKMPAILEALLHAVPQDVLDWKPGAERWSIHEVMSHLVGLEKLYLERARRILQEDTPELPKFVPGGALGGPSSDAIDKAVSFAALRGELMGIVRGAPASA